MITIIIYLVKFHIDYFGKSLISKNINAKSKNTGYKTTRVGQQIKIYKKNKSNNINDRQK